MRAYYYNTKASFAEEVFVLEMVGILYGSVELRDEIPS